MHPYLRTFAVVASATCGIAALLLWIRTGYSCDTVFGPMPPGRGFVVTSRQGGLSVGFLHQMVPDFGTHAMPPETVPQLPYRGALGFYACNTADRFAIRSPYWFYILASGLLFGAITLKTPPRFSLLAMLVAMTLVAIVLAFVVAAR
jgi:hypothetical protein